MNPLFYFVPQELPLFNRIAIGLINVAAAMLLFTVYSHNKYKDARSKIFALMGVLMLLWVDFAYLARLAGENALGLSETFLRVAWVATPLLFYATYLFSIQIMGKLERFRVVTYVLLGFAVLTSAVTAWTDLIIRGVSFSNTIIDIDYGVGFYPFLVIILAFIIFTLVPLFRTQTGKAEHGFLIGVVVFYVANAIFNIALPVFFNITHLYYFGDYSTIFLLGFTAYAIIKHKFLDIRTIIARSIALSLLVVLLGGIYATCFWLIATYLAGGSGSPGIITSVSLALVIALTFQPLRKFFEGHTERIFFSSYYEPNELLAEVSHVLATTYDLKKITSEALDILMSTLHSESGALLLLKSGSSDRVIRNGIGQGGVVFTQDQVEMLARGEDAVTTFSGLEEGSLKNLMRQNSIGAIVRLVVKDEPVGVLILGVKKSGVVYSTRDREVLAILGPQLAISVKNALQYEEIKQFSEKLAEEVDRATSELRHANDSLKSMDEQKNEFISMAAHELRGPLTAIRGYLSMMLDGDGGPITAKMRDFLVDTTAINDRLVRLVNNMLNVSRIERGELTIQPEIVSMSQVVRGAYAAFKYEAQRKGLVYSMKLPEGVSDYVRVDPDRLNEVISNLLSNAVKYTLAGYVTVRVFMKDNVGVRVEISDSGPGISAEEQEKLFRKFYRVASIAGKTIGTGLGLYISKLLIEKFGGKIGVESEVNRGSTFWIELPVVNLAKTELPTKDKSVSMSAKTAET